MDNQQPTRVKLIRALSGSTHGKVWVLRGLRYMLLPLEIVIVSRDITVSRVTIGLVQEEMLASKLWKKSLRKDQSQARLLKKL